MARMLAHSWRGCTVVMEMDSLGLKKVIERGRHRDRKINDILKELSLLQVKFDFTLEPQWIRRCRNEAADALSKDDMERFWRNVMGNRTQIMVEAAHLRVPDGTLTGTPESGTTPAKEATEGSLHQRTATMRRTTAARQEWETRPTRHITDSIRIRKEKPEEHLREQLRDRVQVHAALTNPNYNNRAGVRHYLKFCERIGKQEDVVPPLREMIERLRWWMADAPTEYVWKGRKKKSLATSSISTYATNIDHWWAHATGNPRRILLGQPEIVAERRLIAASYRSGQRQVHGLTYGQLKQIMKATTRLSSGVSTMLRAAYGLAWFGMLRPTEYMLTPAHNTFDTSRHMRAGDITLFKDQRRLEHNSSEHATHMTVNVKQSKTDWQRMGATLTIGATGGDECPVKCMQVYLRTRKVTAEEPLFPGLRYTTMLPTLRKMIGKDAELYGLHSFRVGGAQALAMAGRSFEYIMAKGRWKCVESVIRYVETPLEIRITDSRDMTMQRTAPPRQPQSVWGGEHDPEMGRPRNCPRSG
jgi:hypothetical protein